MIQRIQSLYLLIAAIITATLFKLSFLRFITISEEYIFTYKGLFDTVTEGYFHTNYAGYLLILMVIFFPLLTIFIFNRRTLQIKFCNYTLIFILLLITELIYYIIRFQGILDAKIKFDIGILIPVISFLLVYLARKNIQKDEDLVKSVDRIR